MLDRPSVLIVDDDLTRLKAYGRIVKAAGYRALPAEVRLTGVDLPGDSADLVLLDDRLGSRRAKAVEVARLVRSRSPSVPIIVVSKEMCLPDDIAPLATASCARANPAKLIDRLQPLLPSAPKTAAG